MEEGERCVNIGSRIYEGWAHGSRRMIIHEERRVYRCVPLWGRRALSVSDARCWHRTGGEHLHITAGRLALHPAVSQPLTVTQTGQASQKVILEGICWLHQVKNLLQVFGCNMMQQLFSAETFYSEYQIKAKQNCWKPTKRDQDSTDKCRNNFYAVR